MMYDAAQRILEAAAQSAAAASTDPRFIHEAPPRTELHHDVMELRVHTSEPGLIVADIMQGNSRLGRVAVGLGPNGGRYPVGSAGPEELADMALQILGALPIRPRHSQFARHLQPRQFSGCGCVGQDY